MPFRKLDIPGFPKPISNIMAAPSSSEPSTHTAGLDAFRGLGGNALHLHGEGGETHSRWAVCEWLRQHDIRDEFFLYSKICHEAWDEANQKPFDRFTPDAVEADIAAEQDLLGINYLDFVYLDKSEEAGIAPVLDAIWRQIELGNIRAFGVRNWLPNDIRSANELASMHSQPPIAAIVTTELSLLTPTQPLWPGYVPFDEEMRNVVNQFGLTVFAHVDDFTLGQCLLGDEDALSRMRQEWADRWETPANREIAARLKALAADRDMTPREVNVACTLNQPFSVIGIAGLGAGLRRREGEFDRASNIVIKDAELAMLRPKNT